MDADANMQNFVIADRDYNENREVAISANNKAFIRKSGPYGFWAITFERGRPPATLGGMYTSWSTAEAAVKDYVRKKGNTE